MNPPPSGNIGSLVMRQPADPALAAECGIFTWYLVERPVPADVVDAYLRAHAVSPVTASVSPQALDHAVLCVARIGPRFARAADAFAALAARGGLLRRKLVLLVAILESRGDTVRSIDRARPGSRVAWVAEVAGRALLSLLAVVAATALIAPMTAWYLIAGSPLHATRE